MTSLLDLWRAVDPDARLVSGEEAALGRPVRGVLRTRAAPPHLPPAADGELLVTDAALVADGRADALLAAIAEAGLAPAGVLVAGVERPAVLEPAGLALPFLASGRPTAALADAARTYLDDEPRHLAEVVVALRLAGSEAALADPRPSAPAGVTATRLRRGVAVAVEGRLLALNPRPAGRALAGAFSAAFTRLLAATGERDAPPRRTGGLWVVGRRIGAGASVWLFDDLPFARVDEAGLDALVVTLRALLRRAPASGGAGRSAQRRQPPSSGDPLRDTLLAVARANGRIAPAARTLGVHRNTVLYRLRRARAEHGLDPRRPEDALRLLRETEDRRG